MSKETTQAQEKQPAGNGPQQPAATLPAMPVTVGEKVGLRMDSQGRLDLPSLGMVLAQSGFFPDVRRMSQGIVKVMVGQELGFGPMQSMIGVHIVTNDDRVSVMIGAHLIAGKIRSHPRYGFRPVVYSNEKCELEALERGADGKWMSLGTVAFTLQDALRAKLGGAKDGKTFNSFGNWAKWPRRMCFARAITELKNIYFPDVTTIPVYTPDELGFREDEAGAPVVVAGQFVDDETGTPAVPAKPAEPVAEERKSLSAVNGARLFALGKKHKWEQWQVLAMITREDGWTEKATVEPMLMMAAEDLTKAHLEKLQALIDESKENKLTAALEQGYDAWLDSHTNPPPAAEGAGGEQGKLI